MGHTTCIKNYKSTKAYNKVPNPFAYATGKIELIVFSGENKQRFQENIKYLHLVIEIEDMVRDT